MDVVEIRVIFTPPVTAVHSGRKVPHPHLLAFGNNPPERMELNKPVKEVGDRIMILGRDMVQT